ncbi:hypothetical protein GIB67_039933, partial [Kingdonia uniflora]
EHENVTELVLVTLEDGVEEGRRFLNEEKNPMTLKELNEESYEVFPDFVYVNKQLEGRRFLNEEKNPMTLKELNEESYENFMKAFHLLLFNGSFIFPECILIFGLILLLQPLIKKINLGYISSLQQVLK